MKRKALNGRIIVLVVLLCLGGLPANRAEPPVFLGPLPPTISGRGPHSRTWQTAVPKVTSYGKIYYQTNEVVELQTGLHRHTPKGWVETSPKIEVVGGRGVVQGLQYSAVFPGNAEIELTLPEGKPLKGNVFGLAFLDGELSVLLAENKPCAGEISGPQQNVVTFRDAFTDLEADVQFVVERGKFSQSLILRSRLPDPATFGLSDQAVLTLLTEFTEFPAPEREARVWTGEGAVRDEQISMGIMQFSTGRAFAAGAELEQSWLVGKTWEQLRDEAGNRRTFLLEQIAWKSIRAETDKLPLQAQNANARNQRVARKGLVPPVRKQAQAQKRAIQMAQADTSQWRARDSAPYHGFVLDYELLVSTNYFEFGPRTYYVNGPFNIVTNKWFGGAVVKYAPTNNAKITITGPILNYATNGHPILFVGRDDHSVGEQIGTSSLTNTYATTALVIDAATAGQSSALSHLRIANALLGIQYLSGTSHMLSHAQIVNCERAFEPSGAQFWLKNCLIYNVSNVIAGSQVSTCRMEHVTMHLAQYLNAGGACSNVATNSLFAAVTNLGTWWGNHVQTTNSDTGVFVSQSFGHHYLPTNSPFRSAATATNLSAGLYDDLKRRTTHPPVAITTNVSGTTILGPYAPRDAETIGYHYEPLDFILKGIRMTGTLIATNGVGIGLEFGATNYALKIGPGTHKLISEGKPASLNTWVRTHAIQELPAGTNLPNPSIAETYVTGSSVPSLTFRFTDLPMMAGAYLFHQQHANGAFGPMIFKDSQVRGGSVYLSPGNTNQTTAWTNSLFERVATTIYQYPPTKLSVQNCLFKEGSLSLQNFSAAGTQWKIYQTQFDRTSISQDPEGVLEHSRNVYTLGFNRLNPDPQSDLILTDVLFESGPLGRYYQPSGTPLIDRASAYASSVGLYHYGIQIGIAETNTMLDSGLHYLVLNAQGEPEDSNTNGIPNYVDDADGDGIVDSGEMPFTTIFVSLTSPTNGAIFNAGESITLNANASAPYSPITWVEFYSGTNLLSQDLAYPFSYAWNLPPGIHTLTARARADAAIFGTSAPVTITVYKGLFVVGSTNLSAQDTGIKSRLETLNFYPLVKDDSEASSNDAIGRWLVVISRSAQTNEVGTKFRASPVPVLTWREDLYAWLGMTGSGPSDRGMANDQSNAVLVAHHPIAGELTGSHQVTSISRSLGWGKPAANAVKVTTLTGAASSTNRAAIFGYESNAPMFNLKAPARRAAFFLGQALWSDLTATGIGLFDRTIQWLTSANTLATNLWIAPTNNSVFIGSTNLTLTTFANDHDSDLRRVNFYRDGIRIGTANVVVSNQYHSMTWSNVPGGTYLLTAKAIEKGDVSVTSTQFVAVSVTSNILFVAGSSLNAADTAIKTRLENRGYVVTVRNGASVTSADAEGKNAVLISATASAADITNKLTKSTAPVVVWHSDLLDDLGMAGLDTGSISDQSNVVITAIGDPMAAGLTGTNAVATALSAFTWAKPGTNAVTIATLPSDSTKAAIFRYEKSKLMAGLGTNAFAAPARRVGFFLGSNTADHLNANGWALFDAALGWAIERPCFPKMDVMLVVDRSGSLAGQPFLNLKAAASNFVQMLRVNVDRVGLVSFTDTSRVDSVLTTNFSLVVSNLYALGTDPGTRIQHGINTGQAELESVHRSPDAVPVMILFSDGEQVPVEETNLVLTAAADAKAKGTRLITIRFDDGDDQGLMEHIASPGDYHYAPDTSELGDIYNAVAELLCLVSQAPSVSITNPIAGATFLPPANVLIQASATDAYGYVVEVEFFSGTSSIGKDFGAPWSITWTNVPTGKYTLTAVARDNSSLSSTSAPVSITVNAPPTVSITTPTNNTIFGALPTNVTITASASDDGAVTNVAFFSSTNLLANDRVAPYSIVWANIPSGTYSLTAVATDDYGAKATSAVVAITVANPAPIVTLTNPTDGVTFVATASISVMASATDGGGSVTNVEFFNGTSSFGPDTSTPYSMPLNNLGPGNYALTAVATDNSGQRTTSAVVHITVIDAKSRTWTRNVDFAEGHMVNLNFDDVPHQLQLNKTTATYPYVWVPCSGRDTIVRIDANTGHVLGEYRTAPTNRIGYPSRTAIDKFGNVWVANRNESASAGGSVARIGLVIGGTRGYPTNGNVFIAHPNGEYLAPPFAYNTCIDRSGNAFASGPDGYIRTSRGLAHILPWTNPSGVDDNGGVSSAEDEAIINYIRTGSNGPIYVRTLAVDVNNDLWVGGNHESPNSKHVKIDSMLGIVLTNTLFETNAGGYGGLIDGSGVLWSGRGGGKLNLLRFDPATNGIQNLGSANGTYGLGIDPTTGDIWHTDYDVNRVCVWTSAGVPRSNGCYNVGYNQGALVFRPKGIVVDRRQNVWIPLSEHGFTVEHLRTDGTYVGSVVLPCGADPTGVALDSNGKIWVTPRGSNKAMRIDPNGGPLMLNQLLNTNGYPVGVVDLTVELGTNANSYGFGDMTGFVTLGTTSPSGIWTVIHDSSVANTEWGTVKWSPTNQPAGTGVKVEVRAAATEILLTNGFQMVTNDVSFFGTVTGRYFQVRVTLTNAFGVTSTPILEDLTVAFGTNAPVITTNAPYLAQDDNFEIWQDSRTNRLDVLRNDFDPAGGQISIGNVSAPRYGTFTTTGPWIVYTPSTNFFGKDRFIYTVKTPNGAVGRGLVTVTVSKLEKTNEPPVANDDFVTVKANSGQQFQFGLAYPLNVTNIVPVLNNDSNAARIVFAEQGRNGTVTLDATTDCVGRIFYSPKQGFVGTDSFTYAIINPQGVARAATVNVRVIGDPIRSIQCGQSLLGSLATNDGYLLSAGYYGPEWIPGNNGYTGDVYSFSGTLGMTVTASLTRNPATFSSLPYMCIVSPSGGVLSFGCGTNIASATLPSTGTYFVEVCSLLTPAAGDYELTLKCDSSYSQDISVARGPLQVTNNGSLDFQVMLTNTAVDQSLVIYNAGYNSLLVLSNHSITGPFSLVDYDTTMTNFLHWEGKAFSVRFSPMTVGLHTGSLAITNNDPDENPFVINLRGWGSATGDAPLVQILWPTDNAQFADPRDMFVDIAASAISGSITQVLLFITNAVTSLTGRDTNSPYQFLWTAPGDGVYTLYAQAYDSVGRAANSSNVTVLVGTNIANLPPIAVDDYFTVPANSVSNRLYVLANDSDPNGDPLTIVTNASVIGVMTNTGTHFIYTPPEDSIGTNVFTYQITDGRRAAAIGRVTLAVTWGGGPAVAITNPAPNAQFTLPATVTIGAEASSGSAAVSEVEFYVNGERWSGDTTSPYSTIWTDATAGRHVLQAVATDSAGFATVSAPVEIEVKGKPGNQFPIARLSNLSNTVTTLQGGLFITNYPTLREGLFVVTGTADDPDGEDAVSYKLLVKAMDARAPSSAGIESPVLWSTTGQGRVVNTNLGTLDLSMLRNGIYDLELRVYDGSDTRSASRRFILDSELKIGHFSFSEQDLVIPVNGIPLTVTRTYNSLNPNVGDFGHSWTYALSDVELELDEERDWNQDVSGEVYEQRTGGGRNVTLTLPDGRRATFVFYFEAGPTACQCYNGKWAPPPGVFATLTTLEPATGTGDSFSKGDNTLEVGLGFPFWTYGSYYTPEEAYDFPGFILTMQDGTQYRIERPVLDNGGFFSIDDEGNDQWVSPRGKAKLRRITQRTNDRIQIFDDKITHLNATGAVTRSVLIKRDESGRISELRDPIAAASPSAHPVVKYTYDDKGNLSEVARLVDRATALYLTNRYFYTNLAFPHYLTGIQDPRGIQVARKLYDDAGRLVGIIDADGRTNSFVRNISNRWEIAINPKGYSVTSVYDTRGNITNRIDALGRTNHFRYDTNGYMLAHIDPLGNITTYTNDARGNVLGVTLPYPSGADPAKYTTRYTYDTNDNQTSIVLPTGGVITNKFSATGNLMETRDGAGNIIVTNDYDGNGLLTAEGDQFGALRFGHDAMGNATRMTNSLGQVIQSGYNPNGEIEFLIENGVSSSFDYDAQGRETFSSYGHGITVSNSYNSQLDWNSVNGPTIGHMERRFDSQGRLAGWTTPNGSKHGFAYDANGQMEYETNSIGVVTRQVYDPAGRLISVTNLATGASASYAYDAAGQRIAETNALGHVTRFDYNPDGSLKSMTNAFGTNVWTYAYDTGAGCCGGNGGTTTSVTDPLGREVTDIRSPLGLPLQIITKLGTNAVTNTTVYLSGIVSADQEGENYPASIIDEGGRTRNFGYTTLGQLEHASDLSGNTYWTNRYSTVDGSLLEVISPTGETNSFVYDGLDNVKTNRFPDGNLLINYYNAENRLASNALPSGASVHLKYDSAGRLTNRVSAIGETASFQYNGNDAVTLMTDNTGTTTNLYDAAGRLIGIDFPTGASIRYELDKLDRITTITNRASSAGTAYVVRYAYDAVGNITNVTDPFGGVTTLEYDRVGRRTKRTLPNGITTEWQHNWRDQITNIVHKNSASAVLASVAYERAPFGEPTKITRENGSYVLLKYDAALRLTNEQHYATGGGLVEAIGYGYDASGSRIRLSNSSGMFTNAVEKGYRVTAIKRQSDGATIETYGYDSGGRITSLNRSDSTLALGYNTSDQLTAVTNGATWTQFTHDAVGRRTKAVDQTGAQRLFLVADTPGTDLESAHLIADSNNALKQGYIYLGDQPVVRYDANGASSRIYYLEDAMGSIIGLAPESFPASGNTTRLFYDGFGSIRSTNGPAPAIPPGSGGDFRFQAAWWELTTDLHHMRAREYDGRTGRFLSRDPDGGGSDTPESFHPYNFADCNPHIFSDPTGEFTLIEINLMTALQFTLQTLRAIAVNEGKHYAYGKLVDAFSRTLLAHMDKFIQGFDMDKLRQYLSSNPLGTGGAFDRSVRAAFCETIGRIDDLGDRIHYNVRVVNSGPRQGDPISAGRNCNGPNARVLGQTKGARYSIPDFIFGPAPLIPPGGSRGMQMTHFIAEVKSQASTMYGEYISPGRNTRQLNAILAYSKWHTDLHVAMFIIAKNDLKTGVKERAQYYLMRRLMGSRALSKGVIPAVVNIL